MADKKPSQPAQPKTPSNVVSLAQERCTAEGCKHRSSRAGFCAEHYDWFKEGLITSEGYHAKDFDKKHALYMSRKSSSAKKVA